MTTMSQRAALKRARLCKPQADRGDRLVGWVAIPLLVVLFAEQIARWVA